MADDPRVVWELANPHGILIDELKETWWSGRVFDLKELDNGEAGLLLATETGGVWLVDTANHALPLSDTWDDPDVNSLAAGPDGARHFFAGCNGGRIYETDASQGHPLLHWTPVDSPLPPSAGAVFDIAVIRRHRLILAACAGGLFWAKIPEAPQWWCVLARLPPRSGKRPAYKWTRATEQNVGQAGYYSIAVASLNVRADFAGENDLTDISILAGATSGGILVGRWSSGTLSLTRPKLMFGDADIARLMFGHAGGPTSVASCQRQPSIAYGVCAKADGRVHMLARTGDGGQTWFLTQYKVNIGGEEKDIRIEAGDQGAGSAPNNCIAVHPAAAAVFAFGWQHGTFISPDEGKTWLHISAAIHHADVHALLFKPTTDGKNYLYVGSDGGLAQVLVEDVFTMPPVPYQARSDFNRNLSAIQFYATTAARHFYGTTSIAPDGSGRVSAGVHDNGNIFCRLSGAPTPWRQLSNGDGGFNGIVKDGGVFQNTMGEAAIYGQKYGDGFVHKGVVPVQAPPEYPGGLISPFADVVRSPDFQNRYGQPLFAVTGNPKNTSDVHGLFQGSVDQTYHWELLGKLPDNLAVSAVASYDGRTVMVASGNRIFALDSRNSSAFEFLVDLPKPAPSAPQNGGTISRITMLSHDVGFAMLNFTNQGNCYILRLERLRWVVPLSNGLPIKSMFHGLDGIVHRERTVLFAATDDRVYLSEDAGENWVQASRNLPRVPHNADIRIGHVGGAALVFLGTFGRSLWRANLNRLKID